MAFLIISSCEQTSHKVSAPKALGDAEPLMQPSNNENHAKGATLTPLAEHKLIKMVRMQLKVESVEKDLEYFVAQATALGGYVGNSDQKTNQWAVRSKKVRGDSIEKTVGLRTEATAVIKVPTEKLEQFLKLVESKALAVKHKTSEIEDVTEKMLDLRTRIDTKLRIEKKYINIIENKTGKLEEILKVEEKIDKIREEIEIMEGKLKYFNQRVAFSTVHLNMHQEPFYQTVLAPMEQITDYEESFAAKAKNAFLSGWNLLQDLAIALFYIWPLIIVTLIVLSYVRYKKQFRAKAGGHS